MPATPAKPAFVVGAYASWPTDAAQRHAYLDLLAARPWSDGLEIPFSSAEELNAVLPMLPVRWDRHVLTDIGATMQRLGRDSSFGLASPDLEGRAAAVAFARELWGGVARLNEHAGRAVVAAVELHSAPTNRATVDALAASLDEVAGWDWGGATLTLEHCDRGRADRPVEKGFLALEDEVALARDHGVGITVNWGRRCLEERDAAGVAAAIADVRAAGVLSGVIFSGASGESTGFGPAWVDGHLPASPDEPASLMTPDAIAVARRAAVEGEPTPAGFLGAKICGPAEASLEERVAMIEHIAAAAGVAA